METQLSISALRGATGISKSYASEILNGKRRPSPALAIKIYRQLGHRTGPIVGLSDSQIADVERGLVALVNAA